MTDAPPNGGSLETESSWMPAGKGDHLNGSSRNHSFSTTEGANEVSGVSASSDNGGVEPAQKREKPREPQAASASSSSSPQLVERPIHSEKKRPSWQSHPRASTPPRPREKKNPAPRLSAPRVSLQNLATEISEAVDDAVEEGPVDFLRRASVGLVEGITEIGLNTGLIAEDDIKSEDSSSEHGDFPEGLPRTHEGVRSSSSSNSGGEAARGQSANSRSNLEERFVPPQRQTGKTSRGDDNEEPEDREDEQEGFTATLRRASMTLGAGIGGLFGVGGDSPAVPQPEQQPPHGGVASSSSASGSERPRNGSNGLSASQQSFQATGRAVAIGSRLADGCSQTVDVHRLLKETRRPFRRLIMEVQTPQLSCTKAASGVTLCDARGDQGTNGNGAASSSAEARDEQSRDAQARSPLLSAIVRARLIGYVLGCCEAVTSELSPDEARLWDAFVTADIKLTGTIAAATELRQVLIDCFGESEHTSSWCRSMGANADENGEIDFADLLDWYTTTSKVESLWFVRSSVRDSLVAGLGQILNASAARQTAPRMRPERISQLRTRCADLAPTALAEAAVAYQRSLMLTSCWQCENRLMAIIKSASTAQGQNEQRTSLVHTLLSVLRSINSELAPTERVLWEVIGSKDSDFDCSFTKQEVLAGIGELLVYTLERELATPSEEFEELQRLRSECQRRSVETLFQEGRLTASLSDVIWWWWDLPEEYRIAAGLSVPAALLRRSVTRKPEEMFKDKLRLAATNASVANTALRGHVRAYAELRALVVRRTVEGLHCRSPTETWTTCTSDAGTSRAPSSERKRGSGVVESDD